MSGLYNMMFGESGMGDTLLFMLGLTKAKVGRYRDAWVETDRIVIYTRNGGGNREQCSCTREYAAGFASHHYPASESLREHRYTPTMREVVISEGKHVRSIAWEPIPEAERIEVVSMKPWCDAPDSSGCACTACISNYLLPTHPLHRGGIDDEFDSTYRREFFAYPPNYAADLAKIALDEPIDPSERWQEMLANLRASKP